MLTFKQFIKESEEDETKKILAKVPHEHSVGEQLAVDAYREDSEDINHAAHENEEHPHHKALDSAIANSPTPSEIKLHTGMRSPEDTGKSDGDHIVTHHPAYTSLSTNSGHAAGYSRKGRDRLRHVGHVTIPKGTPALQMRGEHRHEDGADGEEVVVGRGHNIRWHKKEIKDGVCHWHGTLEHPDTK